MTTRKPRRIIVPGQTPPDPAPSIETTVDALMPDHRDGTVDASDDFRALAYSLSDRPIRFNAADVTWTTSDTIAGRAPRRYPFVVGDIVRYEEVNRQVLDVRNDRRLLRISYSNAVGWIWVSAALVSPVTVAHRMSTPSVATLVRHALEVGDTIVEQDAVGRLIGSMTISSMAVSSSMAWWRE